ncbi:cellulose synthase A catalytic subunit 2, partial [Trifolium medium]|nr:cellulose synthase A catalytic subunit 2 [Trifolium medium]
MLSAHLNNIGRSSQMNTSGITTPSKLDAASVAADIPFLTYDHE